MVSNGSGNIGASNYELEVSIVRIVVEIRPTRAYLTVRSHYER